MRARERSKRRASRSSEEMAPRDEVSRDSDDRSLPPSSASTMVGEQEEFVQKVGEIAVERTERLSD